MIHVGILRHAKARFFWWAVGLTTLSILLYSTQGGVQPPNGGTWQGYVLGTVGALLIVWLAMLGIRKRSYSSTTGSVPGWTSAHVYLGTALLVIATLHSAGQLGWNVHSLSYALMFVVIVSGFYGIYTYVNYPQSITDNRSGSSRAAANWLRKARMTLTSPSGARSNVRPSAVASMRSCWVRIARYLFVQPEAAMTRQESRSVIVTSSRSST